MGCSWPRRGIRPARRPVRTRNITVLHGPSRCGAPQGAPCYPTNPARRFHPPNAAHTERGPMKLFISTRSHLGIPGRAASAKAPMVAGWVPLGTTACTEAQLGESSKSGGSEGASCGRKIGAAGHSQPRRKGRRCQVLSSSTRLSGSSKVNSAQFLAMAFQAPRVGQVQLLGSCVLRPEKPNRLQKQLEKLTGCRSTSSDLRRKHACESYRKIETLSMLGVLRL